MTIGDQDHGAVPVTVATVLAGMLHQCFDLARGEILSNCTVYDGWRCGVGCLFRHGNFPRGAGNFQEKSHFLYSLDLASVAGKRKGAPPHYGDAHLSEPSPLADVATWERHLAAVRRLPDDTLLKAEMVEAAEAAVTRLREG